MRCEGPRSSRTMSRRHLQEVRTTGQVAKLGTRLAGPHEDKAMDGRLCSVRRILTMNLEYRRYPARRNRPWSARQLLVETATDADQSRSRTAGNHQGTSIPPC